MNRATVRPWSRQQSVSVSVWEYNRGSNITTLWLPKVVHPYRPESVSSTVSISSWPLRMCVCSPSTTAPWSLVQLTAWGESLAEQLRSRRSPK
ncbi:hypothetical protein EYF80_020719 [Liparis tanakae]|uniref:Uncharacterized protein n=1 Tax=Liparis tanakae TaxID=230148 RepID=A0A4Z2HT30_9TELE|nr:hypothetical protein EYF80_020719 [Liparis tanakae]